MEKSTSKSALSDELEKTRATIAELKQMTPDMAIGRIARMDVINNKAISEVASH